MSTMWESSYYSLINTILYGGELRPGRNGATKSVFGHILAIQSRESPLLHGRKMYPKGVIGELAAMLKGADNVKTFKEFGCHYWDKWAKEDGSIELDYGTAWRNYNGVDQLERLISGLCSSPTSRRHIISGWRPDRLDKLSLPCCHTFYQWYVSNNGTLDMLWYQRSVDVMVGLPSDILFAVLWNRLVAQTCKYTPGKVTMILGDTHIYSNHFEGAEQYLKQNKTFVPKTSGEVILAKDATVFNFDPSMVEIKQYEPAPAIKFELNL